MFMHFVGRTIAAVGLCATALSAVATTGAAVPVPSFSGMVVFGDSISDSGNNARLMASAFGGTLPPAVITSDFTYSQIPSSAGTYSNGKVWTQYLAESLGLTLQPSLAGGTNFAFGGATTGVDGSDIPGVVGFPYSMRTQVQDYLTATGNRADANALYIVAGGGNNVRVALEAIAAGADSTTTLAALADDYAADMLNMVDQLQAVGARHVLVVNAPNFGLTPYAHATGLSGVASFVSASMDNALAAALATRQVQTFDLYGFMTGVVDAGAASGFSNWTNACAAAVNACDLDSALFWDAIHPTTKAHAELAAAVLSSVVAVPEPEIAAMMLAGLLVVAVSSRRRRALGQQG